MARVFLEGDKACERGDQRSHTADVHAHKKLPVIFCKLGQQNGGRHVADALAGQRAETHNATV